MNLEIQIQFEEDPVAPEIYYCYSEKELEKIINKMVTNSDKILSVFVSDLNGSK